MIKEITKEIIEKNAINLTQIEVREIFDEIYQGLSDSISTTAFITAIQKMPITKEIIQAIIEASMDAIKKPSYSFNNMFETTCISNIKEYPDIYFAVDIINSANGIKSIKYATDNFNNSNLFKKFCTKTPIYSQEMYNETEEKNFCYYYLDNNEKYTKYTYEIRKNLDFETIFNFIDCFLNPYSIKNHMIGVSNPDDVEATANLALLLNYENTVVVSSKNNLPYAVLDCENTISEAWKNKIFTYTMTADLLDLPVYSIDEIKLKNNEEEFEVILDVFKNKEKNALYYTIVLNSGLALYISKTSPSLIDGIKLAQKTIDSGLAYKKIQEILETC